MTEHTYYNMNTVIEILSWGGYLETFDRMVGFRCVGWFSKCENWIQREISDRYRCSEKKSRIFFDDKNIFEKILLGFLKNFRKIKTSCPSWDLIWDFCPPIIWDIIWDFCPPIIWDFCPPFCPPKVGATKGRNPVLIQITSVGRDWTH